MLLLGRSARTTRDPMLIRATRLLFGSVSICPYQLFMVSMNAIMSARRVIAWSRYVTRKAGDIVELPRRA